MNSHAISNAVSHEFLNCPADSNDVLLSQTRSLTQNRFGSAVCKNTVDISKKEEKIMVIICLFV